MDARYKKTSAKEEIQVQICVFQYKQVRAAKAQRINFLRFSRNF